MPGFTTGPTTQSCKKHSVTETATEDTTTTVCRGLLESPQMTRMNGSGDIRKEATDRIMKVIGTKNKIRIDFWNVRTLYQTRKLAQWGAITYIFLESARAGGQVLEEWKHQREKTVLYAGRVDNQHHAGAAIVLKKGGGSITKTVLHWTPEGRCKRGRPKNSWRRTVETELRVFKQSWNTIQQLAKNTDSSESTLLLPCRQWAQWAVSEWLLLRGGARGKDLVLSNMLLENMKETSSSVLGGCFLERSVTMHRRQNK